MKENATANYVRQLGSSIERICFARIHSYAMPATPSTPPRFQRVFCFCLCPVRVRFGHGGRRIQNRDHGPGRWRKRLRRLAAQLMWLEEIPEVLPWDFPDLESRS